MCLIPSLHSVQQHGMQSSNWPANLPAALFEPGILYYVLHDDPSVHHVPLPLGEAVPPGRREIPGHHEGEGRVGVYGGVVPLDVGTEGRGYVHLEHLWELLVRGQPAKEACKAGEGDRRRSDAP